MIRKISKSIFFCVFSLLLIVFLQVCYYTVTLPDSFYRSSVSELKISSQKNITAREIFSTSEINVSAENSTKKMTLFLYGIFPIKTVNVKNVDTPKLVPLGQPFGLKISADGIVVTDSGCVESENGKICPANNGGLLIGDIIVDVNGKKVRTSQELSEAIQIDEEKTILTVIRGDTELELTLIPAKSKLDGLYKLGIWTRDSCAGIGTLTYFDKNLNVYGGLGHSVCDTATGQIIPLFKGEIVPVYINEVKKGVNGQPGELGGIFLSDNDWGSIELNTSRGVFGYMYNDIPEKEEVEIKFKQDVEIGEASILTTLEGTEPKEYSIVIEKINFNSDSDVKNMVIRITDPDLLKKAGGIVQGMSGSPILQDGKLVGAVTHVFVNDIERGYAIFAENMYETSSQLDKYNTDQSDSA